MTTRHPFVVAIVAALWVCVALFVAWRPTATSRRFALLGLAWTVIAAAPAIGYLFIGPDLDGSRYLYLPCAGWAFFVAAAAGRPQRIGPRLALLGLCAIVAVPVLLERQRLIGQWTDAARQRDEILSAATEAAREQQCGEVIVAGLPPRYRTAQLFNNGFAEALALMRGPATGTRSCQFAWSGGRLVTR
jgi:hypothetical protein